MASHAETFRFRKPEGDGENARVDPDWALPDDMQSRLEALVAAGEATRHVCDDGRVLYEIRSRYTPKGEGPLLAEIIRSF